MRLLFPLLSFSSKVAVLISRGCWDLSQPSQRIFNTGSLRGEGGMRLRETLVQWVLPFCTLLPFISPLWNRILGIAKFLWFSPALWLLGKQGFIFVQKVLKYNFPFVFLSTKYTRKLGNWQSLAIIHIQLLVDKLCPSTFPLCQTEQHAPLRRNQIITTHGLCGTKRKGEAIKCAAHVMILVPRVYILIGLVELALNLKRPFLSLFYLLHEKPLRQGPLWRGSPDRRIQMMIVQTKVRKHIWTERASLD